MGRAVFSFRAAPGWWARYLWALCLVMTVIVGLFLWIAFSQEYATAKSWADHLSHDGNFERLTPEVFRQLQVPARLVGSAAWVLGAVLWIFRQRTQLIISNLAAQWLRFGQRLAADIRLLLRDFTPAGMQWIETGAVGVLAVCAGLVRLPFLVGRPMAHDESYTFIAFASRSFQAIISDYHLPNNHIFHTILVKISTSLFGIEPWAVRLPAFAAGVLCVPATYALAKRLFGRNSAVVSAGAVAVLPVMVLYSANARGYSLDALLSLLVAGLAIYLKDHRNLAGWFVWVQLSALGFYTLPTMLYPFGIVVTWLFFTNLIEPPAPAYGSRASFVGHLAAAGAGVVVLTGLLYLPVIAWGTGWDSLAGNPFVIRLSWQELPETLWSRVQETIEEWTMDLPGWVSLLAAAGFGITLAAHRWVGRVKVPMQLAGFAWLAVVILVQRPNAMARVWSVLVPFVVIWVVSGLVELLSRLKISKQRQINLGSLAVIVSLVGMGLFTWNRTLSVYPKFQSYPGEMELLTRYLKPQIQPGDIVIISSDDSPILWYYFKLYGIPDETVHRLERHLFPFWRAFVVVSEREKQTLVSTVEKRGLSPQEFWLDQAEPILQMGQTTLYESQVR